MATSHTELTIYNRALDIITEYPLNTMLDDNVFIRYLRRNFAHTVEASLRQQPWNFACRFWLPVANAEKPLMRWNHAFKLPNGCLRVLAPTVDGLRNGRVMAWAVQGNNLLMNDVPTKGVEYVADVQNPGEWDALFADLIAARLAVGMAHRFTAKNSFLDRAQQMAEDAYEQAELINTFEGSVQQPDEHDIIRARGGDFQRDAYNYDRR